MEEIEATTTATPTDGAATLTAEDVDRIFNEHYAGNASVLTPEFNRVQIFKEALKKHLKGGQ